jgi:hypothetical protein
VKFCRRPEARSVPRPVELGADIAGKHFLRFEARFTYRDAIKFREVFV